MLVARRRFLRIGGLSGLALAFPFPANAGSLAFGGRNAANLSTKAPEDIAKGPLDLRVDNLRDLDQASFTAQLNSHFQLLKNDVVQSTQLILATIFDFKAACRNSNTAALTRESFSLSFRDTGNSPFAQGVYTLRHAQLGTFSLLLVPGHSDDQTYEAVINRLHG